MKSINPKTANEITEWIELEDKMNFAYEAGKNNMDEAEFKKQLHEWLNKRFPNLEVK